MKIFALSFLAVVIMSCQSAKYLFYPERILPFRSDGCTMSPDEVPSKGYDFLECCVKHDFAYWQGGTFEQKSEADLVFKACISERSTPEIGDIYYGAVRIGGGPQFDTSFRWGYGWISRRSYDPLNHAEKKSVEEETKKIRWDLIYRELKE